MVFCLHTLFNPSGTYLYMHIQVLYPEIRTFMAADLANLKQAVTMVSKLLSMGMKDTIEAVSLELYDNFPRELDFRIEVTHEEEYYMSCYWHSSKICLSSYSKCVFFLSTLCTLFVLSSLSSSSQMAFTERARVNLARHSPRVVIPKV